MFPAWHGNGCTAMARSRGLTILIHELLEKPPPPPRIVNTLHYKDNTGIIVCVFGGFLASSSHPNLTVHGKQAFMLMPPAPAVRGKYMRRVLFGGSSRNCILQKTCIVQHSKAQEATPPALDATIFRLTVPVWPSTPRLARTCEVLPHRLVLGTRLASASHS